VKRSPIKIRSFCAILIGSVLKWHCTIELAVIVCSSLRYALKMLFQLIVCEDFARNSASGSRVLSIPFRWISFLKLVERSRQIGPLWALVCMDCNSSLPSWTTNLVNITYQDQILKNGQRLWPCRSIKLTWHRRSSDKVILNFAARTRLYSDVEIYYNNIMLLDLSTGLGSGYGDELKRPIHMNPRRSNHNFSATRYLQ
jgi:hypothetical protein